MSKNYDLCIIGSGVLGSFHAYFAAKRGLKVLLLEKDIAPMGSTVQNFGQVVPSGLNQEWQEFGRRSLEVYKDLQSQIDITVTQNGSIYIASDNEEHELLTEQQHIHNGRNYESIFLTQKSLVTKIPSLSSSYVKSALYYPQEVSVNPRVMVHRLLDYLSEKEQITLKLQSEVIDVDTKGNKINIHTDNGTTFEAQKVIVCCGYTLGKLFKSKLENSQLEVSKLQMLKTREKMPHTFKGNILTGLTIRRYESFEECPSFKSLKTPTHLIELKKYGIHILFKQEEDGSIILGDSHEYASFAEQEKLGSENDRYIDDLILNEVNKITNIPIANEDIVNRWSGFYAQHPAGILNEEVEKNIHLVTGIGGKGMTSSAGYAEANIKSIFKA